MLEMDVDSLEERGEPLKGDVLRRAGFADIGVVMTETGLQFTRELNEEEMLRAGELVLNATGRMTRAANFAKGDWYNALSAKFGERVRAVRDRFGEGAYQDFRVCGYVARAFPQDDVLRPRNKVSWQSYRELAPYVENDKDFVQFWLGQGPAATMERIREDKRRKQITMDDVAPTLEIPATDYSVTEEDLPVLEEEKTYPAELLTPEETRVAMHESGMSPAYAAQVGVPIGEAYYEYLLDIQKRLLPDQLLLRDILERAIYHLTKLSKEEIESILFLKER